MKVEPFFGTSSGKKNTTPFKARIVNPEGGLVYGVIDLDKDADILELVDPHTEQSFLLKDARNTLAILNYELKND